MLWMIWLVPMLLTPVLAGVAVWWELRTAADDAADAGLPAEPAPARG